MPPLHLGAEDAIDFLNQAPEAAGKLFCTAEATGEHVTLKPFGVRYTGESYNPEVTLAYRDGKTERVPFKNAIFELGSDAKWTFSNTTASMPPGISAPEGTDGREGTDGKYTTWLNKKVLLALAAVVGSVETIFAEAKPEQFFGVGLETSRLEVTEAQLLANAQCIKDGTVDTTDSGFRTGFFCADKSPKGIVSCQNGFNEMMTEVKNKGLTEVTLSTGPSLWKIDARELWNIATQNSLNEIQKVFTPGELPGLPPTFESLTGISTVSEMQKLQLRPILDKWKGLEFKDENNETADNKVQKTIVALLNKGEVPEDQLMAQGSNTALSIRDRGMAYMSVGGRHWSTKAQEAEGNLNALAKEFKEGILNPYFAEFDNFQSPLSPAAIDNFLSALNAWEVDPPSGNRDKASNMIMYGVTTGLQAFMRCAQIRDTETAKAFNQVLAVINPESNDGTNPFAQKINSFTGPSFYYNPDTGADAVSSAPNLVIMVKKLFRQYQTDALRATSVTGFSGDARHYLLGPITATLNAGKPQEQTTIATHTHALTVMLESFGLTFLENRNNYKWKDADAGGPDVRALVTSSLQEDRKIRVSTFAAHNGLLFNQTEADSFKELADISSPFPLRSIGGIQTEDFRVGEAQDIQSSSLIETVFDAASGRLGQAGDSVSSVADFFGLNQTSPERGQLLAAGINAVLVNRPLNMPAPISMVFTASGFYFSNGTTTFNLDEESTTMEILWAVLNEVLNNPISALLAALALPRSSTAYGGPAGLVGTGIGVASLELAVGESWLPVRLRVLMIIFCLMITALGLRAGIVPQGQVQATPVLERSPGQGSTRLRVMQSTVSYLQSGARGALVLHRLHHYLQRLAEHPFTAIMNRVFPEWGIVTAAASGITFPTYAVQGLIMLTVWERIAMTKRALITGSNGGKFKENLNRVYDIVLSGLKIRNTTDALPARAADFILAVPEARDPIRTSLMRVKLEGGGLESYKILAVLASLTGLEGKAITVDINPTPGAGSGAEGELRLAVYSNGDPAVLKGINGDNLRRLYEESLYWDEKVFLYMSPTQWLWKASEVANAKFPKAGPYLLGAAGIGASSYTVWGFISAFAHALTIRETLTAFGGLNLLLDVAVDAALLNQVGVDFTAVTARPITPRAILAAPDGVAKVRVKTMRLFADEFSALLRGIALPTAAEKRKAIKSAFDTAGPAGRAIDNADDFFIVLSDAPTRYLNAKPQDVKRVWEEARNNEQVLIVSGNTGERDRQIKDELEEVLTQKSKTYLRSHQDALVVVAIKDPSTGTNSEGKTAADQIGGILRKVYQKN